MKKTLGILSALTISITLSAQHLPGGVAKPAAWTTDGVTIKDSLPADANGYTFFAVTIPTETEGEIFSSNGTIITSQRIAKPATASYINFTSQIADSVPRIVSYRHRASDADTIAIDLSSLPTEGHKDSICESLVFHRLLRNAERQRVDSYLAMKYGITLDQTVPRSYVSSKGEVVWDAVANASHSHRIMALCHDTISPLYKTTATSAEPSSLLTISTDTIATDAYIIAGDDNGSLKYETQDGLKRLGRSWKLQATKNAEPKSLTISLDAAQIEEVRPLENGESFWLAINDSSYIKSADLGMFAARFADVEIRGGMTLSLIAAGGDDQPIADDAVGRKTDNISHLYVAPNPTTDGTVRLRLSLKEVADITIELRSQSGGVFDRQSFSGSDFYALTLTLPTQGVWMATIRTGDESRTIKLLRK